MSEVHMPISEYRWLLRVAAAAKEYVEDRRRTEALYAGSEQYIGADPPDPLFDALAASLHKVDADG